MKKTGVLFVLVAALSVLAAVSTGASEPATTLLVYMCGADLQEAACYDMYEMGLAETGDNVNIVILAGGSSEWDFEEIEGDTRSLITIKDGDFESITDWGWESMGSEESLLEFLEYGLTTYPADRTMVVLWNHGAGSEGGICFDDTTEEQDGLSLTEINDALYDLYDSLGEFHIDVFGCDACMMATYEMASMLSYFDIDYFIASEELEPGTGWNYTPWLEALDSNPEMTTQSLCESIIDSYMEAGLEENPDDYLTLSAVSLDEMGQLQDTIESFALELIEELEQGKLPEVRRKRSKLYTFGSFDDGSWDMVDMGAMLDAYAQMNPDLAAKARQQLSKAVLYRRQTDNLNACSGLSILIPQDTKSEFDDFSEGMDLSIYIPNWISFVTAYNESLLSGSYSFSEISTEQVSGSGFFSQIFDALSGEETFDWDEEEEEYVVSDQGGEQLSVNDSDYAFTADVSAEDLQYLDYVEGMLLMDISDEESTGYVDLGSMRNNLVEWNSGRICSLFDGTWPTLDGQLVPLYDQLSNARGRRSLIPVKLNGDYTYLVVEFAADAAEGRIIGANAGYDENGLPIRTTTRLQEGDSVIPVYTMYIDTGAEDFEEMEFDGDEISWSDDLEVIYTELGDEEADDEEPLTMLFSFVLYDVFGNDTMTDFYEFEV